jgi:hypothetical protein
MSIFDITPAGAYVQALDAAAKSDQREAARLTTTTPKGGKSNLLISATAHFRRAFTRALKTPEGVRLVAETRSRTA